MVALAPFRGLLFDPAVVGDLTAVTAPPYDVILPHEQDRLHRASPYNIALVDLGADVPGDPHEKYTRAADLFRRWRRDRVVVPTDGPAVYPYEMRFSYRGAPGVVRGIWAAVGLEDWGHGVLPHERTMRAPVEDRLRLIRATAADLSPIYAVVEGPSPPQDELLRRTAPRVPDRELRDEEGVVHRLWIEPDAGDLARWYRDRPVMIADGHHRYQTALAHRDEMRRLRGPGPWDSVMMLLVDAATEEPPVLPIHRVLRVSPQPELVGEPVRDLEEILALLVDDDLRFGAVFRRFGALTHILARVEGGLPTVQALHEELVDPMGGVRDLRFTPDAAAAEAAVRARTADLALVLPPARVAHVHTVVEQGRRLPQKSTYFWPKPRTGLVIRPLDGPADPP
jgi:uncharacterized protein (DUF1015 family)